jgi:hypothetical protein
VKVTAAQLESGEIRPAISGLSDWTPVSTSASVIPAPWFACASTAAVRPI